MNEGKPRFERFGGIDIFRPGWRATIMLRNEAEAHFRSVFKPGEYVGREIVNRALQHHFGFYANKLSDILPSIASRDYIEFVLHQYEQSVLVDQFPTGNSFSEQNSISWQQTGSKLRRALKYLAERTVLLWPPETAAINADHAQMLRQAEMALICAEQLIDLYMTSDKVFSSFSEETVLEVLPEGQLEVFRTHTPCDFTSTFLERVHRDAKHRSTYVPLHGLHQIPRLQDTYLADAFRDTIGLPYSDVLAVLHVVIDHAIPPPKGFQIPFCFRDRIVDEVVKHAGFPRHAVENSLAGFTVSRAGMTAEGREVFKPKQEYRAYRRGFFEMPHDSGTHLTWSKGMAQECYVLLLTELALKQIPAEWRSTSVEAAVSRLCNAVGNWFEALVAQNMNKIGIIGLHSVERVIGRGRVSVRIPPEVGEIDFIGYSARDDAIIVSECKYVRGGTESRFFRDEIKAFTEGNGCHMKQLARKVEWVAQNFQDVRAALADALDTPAASEARRILSAMLTHYPNCAGYFWSDAPCVSLTELMLDYQEHNRWPYSSGIHEHLP